METFQVVVGQGGPALEVKIAWYGGKVERHGCSWPYFHLCCPAASLDLATSFPIHSYNLDCTPMITCEAPCELNQPLISLSMIITSAAAALPQRLAAPAALAAHEVGCSRVWLRAAPAAAHLLGQAGVGSCRSVVVLRGGDVVGCMCVGRRGGRHCVWRPAGRRGRRAAAMRAGGRFCWGRLSGAMLLS